LDPDPRAHGSPATAGVLLSAFAAGSWIGGFAYGLAPPGTPAGARYPRLCLLGALGLLPLVLAPSLAAMVALAALAGLCFAPITTCRLAVVDEVAAAAHRAAAFSWLGSLDSAGLAVGAAIAGPLLSGARIRAEALRGAQPREMQLPVRPRHGDHNLAGKQAVARVHRLGGDRGAGATPRRAPE
jgi:hypothetical protein